jgi:hypothetical protein
MKQTEILLDLNQKDTEQGGATEKNAPKEDMLQTSPKKEDKIMHEFWLVRYFVIPI